MPLEEKNIIQGDNNMITFDIFLIGLLCVSTLTGLVTEALKSIFKELDAKYHTNITTGIVAAILSTAISIGYVIMCSMTFTAQIIVCIVALVFMSWLCAMVGYDKVIGQFKNVKGDK